MRMSDGKLVLDGRRKGLDKEGGYRSFTAESDRAERRVKELHRVILGLSIRSKRN